MASKPRALTGADVRSQQPVDESLTCPICKKLVWEAVRTPCCDTAFCEECITTHLLEHDFECAMCESKIASLDKLKLDQDLRDKVKGYVDGEIERSKKDAAADGETVKDEEGAASDWKDAKAENGESNSEGNEAATEAVTNGEGGGQQAQQRPSGPSAATTPALDPVKMQEMLKPQNMQLYMSQVGRVSTFRDQS